MSDLVNLGEKLVTEGPEKVEVTPRRLRGLFGGKYIFDTLEASYVWEHKYCSLPIPLSELHPIITFSPGGYLYHMVGLIYGMANLQAKLETVNPTNKKDFWVARLSFSGKSTDRVLVFESGPLKNLVRIEVSALDAWFVEDEKLLGSHPKDPYKRIETLPSSRAIRIEVDGVVIAESTQNVFLFETMLRPRYYLNPASVDYELLRESETTSYCPYKGMAKYYHISVGGTEIEDAVWYYEYPTSESALVAGRLCFYNEKVDVFVDGVKEKK